jgi:hypothetical protein
MRETRLDIAIQWIDADMCGSRPRDRCRSVARFGAPIGERLTGRRPRIPRRLRSRSRAPLASGPVAITRISGDSGRGVATYSPRLIGWGAQRVRCALVSVSGASLIARRHGVRLDPAILGGGAGPSIGSGCRSVMRNVRARGVRSRVRLPPVQALHASAPWSTPGTPNRAPLDTITPS